jgi:hypothetical protein
VIDRVVRKTDIGAVCDVTVTAYDHDPRGREHARPVGLFQSIICAQCGYTEWYAYDMDWLATLASIPGAHVRFVNGEPGSSGPFR